LQKRKTETNSELDILDSIVRKHFLGKGLYDYQKDLYWRLETNNLNLINKSRQIGISFFYAGYTTLKALEGERNMIASNSLRNSRRVMHYIDTWLDGFSYIFSGTDKMIEEHNKEMLRFDNGGEIQALPNSASTIRGSPADRIFLDEFAHFLHGTDKEVYEAILPSLSRKGIQSICINSTPFGEQNQFSEIFHNEEDYPDYKRVTYHYSECPDIEIEMIRRNMDSLSFQQEYECQFIGDINTYYPYEITKPCINGGKNEEMEYLTVEQLKDFKYPLYGAGDVGRRRDFTAIILLAEIEGKLRVVYKKVLRTIQEKEWENQYSEFRKVLSLPTMQKFYIDQGFGPEMAERLRGEYSSLLPFTFTNENKNLMHPAMRKRFEEKKIEITQDMELINCLHLIQRKESGNTVRYDSDKATDEHGHADLAVALVLANHCYEKEKGTSFRLYAKDREKKIFFQKMMKKRRTFK